jgi:hypothetical protein
MTKPDIDDLLLRMRTQQATELPIDLEQRIWSKIARSGQETAGSAGFLSTGSRLGWRLSAGAIALAAGAGFLAAALAPPVAVARPASVEVWMTLDAPLAPSTILGG